jgi:heme A synthase
MGIVGYLLLVVIVGVLVWAAIRWIPMPEQFKTFLPIAAIVLLILVLVAALGLIPVDYPMPRLR